MLTRIFELIEDNIGFMHMHFHFNELTWKGVSFWEVLRKFIDNIEWKFSAGIFR